MASEVDICKIALAHLGDSATVVSINPPEGSAQAEHCATFYPIARDSLLEMHVWSFITRRSSALALLSDDTGNEWTYKYAQPANVLRRLAVTSPDITGDEPQDFETESADNGQIIIYTNAENAQLRYSAKITDTTKFTPLFVDALGWLLASYLAGPVIKGDSGVSAGRACFQTFLGEFQRAMAADANGANHRTPAHTPDSIAARGGSFPFDPRVTDARIIR